MGNDSVIRIQKVLENCIFTYEKLERDQHIILKKNDKRLSIAILFVFLKLADGILMNLFKPNSDREMEWHHLVEPGVTTATLNEIYPGALETNESLSNFGI